MNKTVLIDSGFWCALYEPRDQYYQEAQLIANLIEDKQLILPWPTLYEFINTRFIRRIDRLNAFNAQLTRTSINYLDDTGYKQAALNEVINRGLYSLVDSVIRQVLSDVNVKIDYFVTFNNADFDDICYRRKIEIISNSFR